MDKQYLLDVATRRTEIVWAKAQKAYPKQLGQTPMPEVRINARLKTTAGRAHYVQHMVEFSAELMWEHTEHFVRDTIPHEVAHIVTNLIFPNAKQHHGPEWKSMLEWLLNGAEAKTYHTLTNTVHAARKAKVTI